MSLSNQYCFFCGLPIIKSKGRGPDNVVEHHISYDPEVKTIAHAYCHSYYHRMLYSHHDQYLLRSIEQEKIRIRFLNRMRTGRGDGHIPYDERTHHLSTFGDVLLRRDLTKFTKEDSQRRQKLRHDFERNAIEMAKTLGLGPQSIHEDYEGIVELVRRNKGILITKHDLRYAGEVAAEIMAEYKKQRNLPERNVKHEYKVYKKVSKYEA